MMLVHRTKARSRNRCKRSVATSFLDDGLQPSDDERCPSREEERDRPERNGVHVEHEP
jgi:hypothetical protein